MNQDPFREDAKRHRYHSLILRGLYSLILVAVVMAFGTFGIHHIEKFSYVDSFYFTSMIATGQGPAPNATPVTVAGKLFTSLLAFISVGSMVASFGFIFGPFLGGLWHLGRYKMEEELFRLRKKEDK